MHSDHYSLRKKCLFSSYKESRGFAAGLFSIYLIIKSILFLVPYMAYLLQAVHYQLVTLAFKNSG